MRILFDHFSRRAAVRFFTGQPAPLVPPAPARRRRSHSSSAVAATRAAVSRGDGGEAVVVIVGATGTGKSKLSIDVGRRYASEVVNSDKMQVYRGLDVTTNKITIPERRGVPHHLLGELDPADGEVSPEEFRHLASARISSIRSRRRLPVVAGGSNSFVHALLAENYDSTCDPFDPEGEAASRCCDLRYNCCFLWVDVGWCVLGDYLDKRVDEMMEMGMVEELGRHHDPDRSRARRYNGLEMAIGVPEFDRFFDRFPPVMGRGRWSRGGEREAWEEAVEEIKRNTRELAARQERKIETMRESLGWEMTRLDATEAVRRKMEGKGKEEVEEAWVSDVLGPAVGVLERWLGSRGGRRWRRAAAEAVAA